MYLTLIFCKRNETFELNHKYQINATFMGISSNNTFLLTMIYYITISWDFLFEQSAADPHRQDKPQHLREASKITATCEPMPDVNLICEDAHYNRKPTDYDYAR